jgi:hypothetical protein
MRILKSLMASIALWILAGAAAHAEPYLAVQQGYACSACHFNATGGGLRSDFGTVFAENVMPSMSAPSLARYWNGRIGSRLAVGADARASISRTGLPGEAEVSDRGLDQLRVYGAATLWPEHLDAYIDETLAPGKAEMQEGYARLRDDSIGLYLKGGQFYLPFGWRLQDSTSFVREVSGINMTTPDKGVELGYERPGWSAQLDYTRGAANAQSHAGHQTTLQVVRIRTGYRVGSALSVTTSALGERRALGVFAGVRTGRIAWLGEVDSVRDEGYPEGARRFVAALGEADWAFAKGHNLKFTAEFHDPDRAVAEDQKTRFSVLWEWTPVPFVQLRTGYRRYLGIPQNALDNRHLAFIGLHAFL